ncbi:MAG: MoaD/ThiS family protein [Putridiphycobacter sp.]
MRIKVKYFGLIAELLKKEAEELMFENQKVVDLKSFFLNRYPALAKTEFMVAVNQTISSEVKINSDIKEIALLPPFAGG